MLRQFSTILGRNKRIIFTEGLLFKHDLLKCVQIGIACVLKYIRTPYPRNKKSATKR